MHGSRSFRRHLLALCTFLAPLSALAFLGLHEFQAQSAEVRSSLDREALQFLQAAQASMDQRLDQDLMALAQEADAVVAQGTPARAARQLRQRGFAAVLDILRIGSDGRLRYPDPPASWSALPFARDAWSRGDDDGAALNRADHWITLGHLDEAAQVLTAALDQAQQDRGARRRGDAYQTQLRFRLATVHQRLGRQEQAQAGFLAVIERADFLRLTSRGRGDGGDAEALACGMMAELALAESDADDSRALDMLTALANGKHDHAQETLILAASERLLARCADENRPQADELSADLRQHLHTRASAVDYERFLLPVVRRRLSTPSDGGPDLRPILAAGAPSTLLMLRPNVGGDQSREPWLGLRLDLNQLIAGALEPFFAQDSKFVLAISDSDEQPILAGPKAPTGFTPPAATSHGMVLRAYPADVEGYLARAKASDRSVMLMLVALFLVGAVGAVWHWRSVSRESELLRLKVDLVSRVSHELKTPLSLISLYGETLALKRARDSEQAAQFGTVITREAGRLTAMIDRILDFSRQQGGTMVYDRRRTDLGETLAMVAETYQPHIAAKGASLACSLPTGIYADVDRSALASVVINLLENALKYGRDDDSSQSLDLQLRRTEDGAEIEVLDRGRGIPADERDRIFETFYRASNAGEVRGAGLGLSLVRHFAEAHGGAAFALPRQGGGAIIRITLPPESPLDPTAIPAATP